jgi:hypothetical protein
VTLPPIDQGTLVALRFFEIADEADLRLAARLPLPAPLRVRPGRLSFVGQLRDLMLDVAVGVRHVPVGEGRAVDADTHVLVFAFGVGAVMAQIRIGQGSGGIAAGIGAAEAAQWVARFNDSDPFTAFARSELAGVLQHLAPALRRAFDWAGYETYCVLAVQRFGEPVAIDRVLASPDVARILLGESADWRPAPALVQQVTAHQFRYGEEDCCIVEWDAALVIDPHNLDDYTDLLSLGLTALLEFRRFDEILEREIGDLYEWLGQRGRGWHWLRIAATRQRLRQVHRLLLEVAEFVDRSENAFKITEDVYYARVYRGAIERFQVPGWRDSVQRRQRIVSDVASMLHNESQIAVSHLLEIIIIVLIAWEVVAALVR